MASNLCMCVCEVIFIWQGVIVPIKEINNRRTCVFVFPNIDTYSIGWKVIGSCSVVLSQLFFPWTWLCTIPLLLTARISNIKQLKAGDSLTFFHTDGKLCWDFHNKLLLQLFKFASQKSYLKAGFSTGQWLPACSVQVFFPFQHQAVVLTQNRASVFLILLIGICLASGILIHNSIMAFKRTFPWRDIF